MSETEEKKAKERDELCAENARLRIKLTEARNIIHDAFHSDDKAFVVGNDMASWRHLSAGIVKLRKLLRPEPDSMEWRTEAVYYGATLPGEYRTPKAAIDAVMANPPLPWGGCKQPIGGEEDDADWRKALYEVPELGFKWRRFSSPRCVRLVGFFQAVLPGGKLGTTSEDKHVHEIAVDRAADGVRWQAVATIDGVESFTVTSGCQWKAERGALAAWRTITRHTCRGTRRNIEAAAAKAAEPQGQQQEDLHTPPARRGEEKAGLNLNGRIDT